MRRQQGFTLLELIVATSIVVIIGVAASVKFNQALTNRDRVGERARMLADLQRTFIFLQRDIEQSVSRPARDTLGDAQPAMLGAAGGEIELTRVGWTNPLDTRQRSTLQRVRYRVADGQLFREYWDHPDRQVGSSPVASVLVQDVAAFRVEYLHRPAGGDFTWAETWPLANDAGLAPQYQAAPLAVSIEIEVAPYGTMQRFFRVPANAYGRGT